MEIIINSITLVFVILIAFTGFALYGQVFLLKKLDEYKIKHIFSKVCDLTIKFFLVWHVPLLILQTIFAMLDIFAFFNETGKMIFTVIITVICIFIERLIEHVRYTGVFNTDTIAVSLDHEPNNIAVFAYIDLYREIEKINLGLIQQLSTSQSDIMLQFEKTENETNLIIEKIDSYAQLQNTECKELLEKKNEMINFFEELCRKAEDVCNVFVECEKKLDNSNKALIYYDEGETLMADVNKSFISMYTKSANDFIKRLDNVEQQLRGVVDQYSGFNDFIQPHIQKVSIYNIRMDNVLQSLTKGINSRHALLENTSKEITNTFAETNKKINETLDYLFVYLQKNAFVLSKILDTYKEASITPNKLRKLLKNWPETSK